MTDTFNAVYPQLQTLDFREDALDFELPIYLVLGGHDSNAAPELAEQWFAMLDAPIQRLEVFERSGHGMLWEEPERFHRLLVDTVLPETLGRADPAPPEPLVTAAAIAAP